MTYQVDYLVLQFASCSSSAGESSVSLGVLLALVALKQELAVQHGHHAIHDAHLLHMRAAAVVVPINALQAGQGDLLEPALQHDCPAVDILVQQGHGREHGAHDTTC